MRSREEARVDAFIVTAKRKRYKTFLANPRRRVKLLEALNHCRDA